MNRTILLSALLLATPAIADTLEIRTGSVSTYYDGVAVDRQFYEGRGRLDFASWNSWQAGPSLDGAGYNNWTVFIDGATRECSLVNEWARRDSPAKFVFDCAGGAK